MRIQSTVPDPDLTIRGGGGGGGGGCHPNWSNLYYGLPLHNGHSFARQSIY